MVSPGEPRWRFCGYNSYMKRITVGVLRGGPSSEYEVSLSSGAAVLSELDRSLYEPRDIFISRNGETG